jgi:hypothetical protein
MKLQRKLEKLFCRIVPDRQCISLGFEFTDWLWGKLQAEFGFHLPRLMRATSWFPHASLRSTIRHIREMIEFARDANQFIS